MSDDALLPLRRAYGVEVPGSPAAGAASGLPGAPQRTEVALLAQTRAAVEAAVAAQDRHPSPPALAAVLARAADASLAALAPLAAVRALYSLPRRENPDLPGAGGAPDLVEATVLSQTRAAVELAISQRPAAPSPAVLAAVLARAADATRLAARPDDAVAAPALAPLAVAYGLSLPAEAAPDAAETALLVQSRSLLDRRPAPAGPTEAVLAAVLAYAASVGTPATGMSAADAPAEGRPVHAPAADRAPLRNSRRVRRVGAWASAAAAMLALVVALMPRAGGAPEMPAATEAAFIGAARADSTPATSPASADLASVAESNATVSGATTSAGERAAAAVPTAPAPAVTRSATAPLPDIAVSPGPSAPRPTASSPAARPAAARPSRDAAPTPALAAADVTPPAPDAAWEAPADVHVLSLRLQALGRTTADLGWDQPAEAFGAPSAAPSRATPGLQSVRETAPAARARLLTVPLTGDR